MIECCSTGFVGGVDVEVVVMDGRWRVGGEVEVVCFWGGGGLPMIGIKMTAFL